MNRTERTQRCVTKPQSRSQVMPIRERARRVSTLITEKQVAFNNAVVLSARPATTHRWSGSVFAAMHRMFVRSMLDGPGQQRRYYSQQYRFLEDSCMTREMDRL